MFKKANLSALLANVKARLSRKDDAPLADFIEARRNFQNQLRRLRDEAKVTETEHGLKGSDEELTRAIGEGMLVIHFGTAMDMVPEDSRTAKEPGDEPAKGILRAYTKKLRESIAVMLKR